jgi:hypothetical protein
MKWDQHSVTSALVLLQVDNNATWSDAFQFGDPDDTTWTLSGCTFEMDVQRDPNDAVPLLQMNTGNGRIIVDDVVQRVVHFNVAAVDIQANLDPGTYVYDFVMLDGAVPPVRTPLMHGTVTIQQGVTFP